MIEFHVADMSCGHCIEAVTAAVKEVDPAAVVDVDLASSMVRVESVADRAALGLALADAGYPADR